MNLEAVYQYCLSKKGVTDTFPFTPDVLVFKVMGKMFALLPLNAWDNGDKTINLKCNPNYATELREHYSSVTEGYHMSKIHWNTVRLNNGEITPTLLKTLIDHSYSLVVKGLPKNIQAQLI